ncbi:MAG: AlkA N-terminal domain-containing protein [Acetobacteraceae bacterium]
MICMRRSRPIELADAKGAGRLDHEVCYRAVLARGGRYDGTFFTAVRTTGIFCRPICPTRPPRAENAIFFSTAAAAHAAGFRPCLRCRPDIAPELAQWTESGVIARAMALIGSGCMQGAGLHEVAVRLGLGERKLRLLFREHFGASPKKIAAARRALLAKQLVADTPLAMADVARASGFGSLRSCSNVLGRSFGRPMRELRRCRTGPAGALAVELTLAYKPPYDWPAMIGFLRARAIPGVERVTADGYARSIALDGASGTIFVCPDPHRDALHVTVRFPNLGSVPAILNRIRNAFDLGADPAVIDPHLARDPGLARLVAARPGMRVPGAWDGFEIAVRAILGQQITVRAASLLAGRLASRYGEVLPAVEGLAPAERSQLFPRPEQIAGADGLDRAIGMPKSRAAAIVSLAKAVAADPALLAPGPGLDESVARLAGLPGIGQWSAHYIAMRVLREPDAFPAADVGLLRAMASAEGRPSPRQLLARAASWRPWRAYAVMHLWTSEAALAACGNAGTKRAHESLSRTRPVADRHDPAGFRR